MFSMGQSTLTLSEAIALGLEKNFDIQLSGQAVAMAEEQNSWGMAGGLPTLSINGSTHANAQLLGTTSEVLTAQASADLQWVLFSGFKVKATKALLDADQQYAEGNEMITLENTIHSIITSYYYVLLQQEMLKVNETVVKISEDQLEQQELLKGLGAKGTYEYVQAQNAYLVDKSNWLKQQVVLRDAMRNLNLLLSLPAETEWVLTESIDVPMEEYSLDAMTQQLLSDNRTLQNQYISLQARDIEITQSRAALFPTIGFNASVGTGNNNFLSENGAYLGPQVGLTLSYNLFNGGKVRRSINMAQISKEMETVTTQQMELSLKSELASQLDGYNVYKEIVALDNEQLAVSETLLQLSEERYSNGTINSFNFREVQLSYLQSATNRLNSIYNLIVVNSQLLRLTGGIVKNLQL